jgi:hypothetical protein
MLSTFVLIVAVPGELIFTLWLLIKGIDEDTWHRRADVPVAATL